MTSNFRYGSLGEGPGLVKTSTRSSRLVALAVLAAALLVADHAASAAEVDATTAPHAPVSIYMVSGG